MRCPEGSRLAKSGAPTRAHCDLPGRSPGAVVLKSQVLTGGRMKAGGVLFWTPRGSGRGEKIPPSRSTGTRAACWSGRQPVAQEYYLGVTWDRIAKRP
jgi:succinyl-CoA synthetase beta subunit/citryl-CoA synthetase large subunit